MNPVSFPGWPSFGDLLCDGGSRTLVGLTFHVPKKHYASALEVASTFSPEIAEFKHANSAAGMELYEQYPESSWLEIKWSKVRASQLIDIQTCDVLWYPDRISTGHRIPVALGIENLEYLVKEADYDLVLPELFPFPPMTIEFLND